MPDPVLLLAEWQGLPVIDSRNTFMGKSDNADITLLPVFKLCFKFCIIRCGKKILLLFEPGPGGYRSQASEKRDGDTSPE
jgi:hypothetical protein